MEKKKNGYFKAVSIIALVLATIYTICLGLIIVGAIFDFESLILEVMITIEDTAGIPESISSDIQNFTITMLVLTCVYIAALSVVHYLAYFKLKKYTQISDEEAKLYNAKIIAWIVIMFLFSGVLNGILMLCGYTSITKLQIENVNNVESNLQNQSDKNQETGTNNTSINTKDLDTMIERLEKLNKIREMGGLTEEEYEILRKKIAEGGK